MNDKKLKPEHRKLWRRVYLNEFEVQNQSPEASEAMADKVVAQWEARGAFDETSNNEGAFATPVVASFPNDTRAIPPLDVATASEAILRAQLHHDMLVAPKPRWDGFSLVPLTQYGHELVKLALEQGVPHMLAHVAKSKSQSESDDVIRRSNVRSPVL